MTLFAWIKCMCCLIRCSKYIYFVKKGICIITAIVAAIICINLMGYKKLPFKKLKEMF